MKKVLLLIALGLSASLADAAENIQLDPANLIGGWNPDTPGINYDAATGKLTLNNWEGNAWNFDPGISTSDYEGVKIELTEGVGQGYTSMAISYENGSSQNISMAEGATVVQTDFIFDSPVKSISFSYGNWSGSGPETGALYFQQCQIIAKGTGSASGENVMDKGTFSAGWSSFDASTLVLNLGGWDHAKWTFNPALEGSKYEKVVFNFAEPIPNDAAQIELLYEGSDNAVSAGSLVKGATKVVAYFPEDKNISAVGFTASDGTELKIASAVIVPRGNTTGGIDATVADNTNTATDVYNLQGVIVRSNVAIENAVDNLPSGLYIVNGKKIAVK